MIKMTKTCSAQPHRKRQAVSPVISTLIISTSVLIVTGASGYLALNMLELQSQHTEFDQGRFNMQTLEELIEDTGVKPSSGSFIRFNERTGGLGYIIDNSRPIVLRVDDGTTTTNVPLTSAPMNVTYRAGRLVGTYNSVVKGKDDLIISGLAAPLGVVKQQQANGAWLTLDFNRVRVVNGTMVNVGSDRYQLITITFFNVTAVRGEFTGSGNLEVKIQNVRTYSPVPPVVATNDVTLTVSYGSIQESLFISKETGSTGIIVMVSVSNLEMSTL